MRYLVYLLTLFFIGTAIAQNPTIVQGDYITNVFGPSNFVKNPNAQINTANVTVSNATVTRGTTTPLVAKSEFTITTSTATGYADWDLRAFDAGMKNNNCEARFTYRGFTVGSTKAQILQGANVVAELTLIGDANNPKQASINFPCGDLSAVTKFRLQQASASLTGTNEIGGIYVGLATNMANVAQAVLYGGVDYTSGSSASVTSASYAAMSGGTVGATPTGNVTSATSNFSFTVSSLPAGDYFVNFQVLSYINNATVAGNVCYFAIEETTSATTIFSNYIRNDVVGGNAYPSSGPVQARFSFTGPATSRTFRIVAKYAGTSTTCSVAVDAATGNAKASVYRFPSSSELVVTPERQNTFAGIKGVASGPTNLVTAASWTKLTAGSTLTRTNFGKAKVETNNDFSITIDNMPVGNFYISTSGVFGADSSASGIGTSCIFGLADSATGGAQIAAMQQIATGDASLAAQTTLTSTMGGVYTNSSVANRTFFVQAYRAGGAGQCYGFTNPERPVTITVIPLDQPTNSALYVEGPVKAAATGAAISAGYVGEEIKNTTAITLTSTTTADVEVNVTNGSITLGVGVWELEYSADVAAIRGPASTAPVWGRVRVLEGTNNISGMESFFGLSNSVSSTFESYSTASKRKRIEITSGTKTYQLKLTCTASSAVGICYVLNGAVSGSITGDDAASYIRAVRVN